MVYSSLHLFHYILIFKRNNSKGKNRKIIDLVNTPRNHFSSRHSHIPQDHMENCINLQSEKHVSVTHQFNPIFKSFPPQYFRFLQRNVRNNKTFQDGRKLHLASTSTLKSTTKNNICVNSKMNKRNFKYYYKQSSSSSLNELNNAGWITPLA